MRSIHWNSLLPRRRWTWLAVLPVALLVAAPAANAQRTLYVTGQGGPGAGVHSYAIDLADGSLDEVGSAVAGGGYPAGPSVNSTGTALAVPDVYFGDLYSYPINPDGSPGASASVDAGLSPNSAIFKPDGSALFAADTFGGKVFGYSASGATLAAATGSPHSTTGTPTTIAVSPVADQVYVPGWLNDVIDAYTYGSNPGELTHLSGFPLTTTGEQAVDMEFSPDAQFVYAENAGTSDIATYSRNASTGALTEVGTRPSLGGSPSGIAASPNGNWVAAVSSGAGEGLQMFSAASNGQLTAIGSTIAVQADGGVDIVFTPDSRFVYVTSGNGGVSGFAIDQSSGAATELPGSPWNVANSTFGITIAPDQGPTAAFSTNVSAGTATFNASASSDPDGTVASYVWNFGDGSSVTTSEPVTTHTYAASGNYTATLTVTDNENCSTVQIGTGQTINCNGSGAANSSATVTATVAPAANPLILSNVSAKEYPLRKGEKRRRVIARYSLNRKAGVTIQFQKVNRGRVVNGKCQYETKSNKRGRKCLHVRNYGGQVKLRGNAGANRKTFVKTFGGKAISRGRYREVIYAADGASTKSKTLYYGFRVQDPGR